MKILGVGDIHGRPFWRDIKPENYDKIVFVGDYVDSYDLNNVEILHNLQCIINFKRENVEKVVLLLGNHDIAYMYPNEMKCGGFRAGAFVDLHYLFNENFDYFQMSYKYKNYLYSHAGISNAWFAKNWNAVNEVYYRMKVKFQLQGRHDFSERLNLALYSEEGRRLLFKTSKYRNEYSNEDGGIIWADKRETENDFLIGYHQIVGHTFVPDILHYKNEELNSSITYIDTGNKFHEIEII